MLKIGITGASGFIGKHFVKKFLEDGYTINIHVRDAKKINFLAKNNSSLKIFEGDIADEKTLSSFIKESDAIIHLAAATDGNWQDYYNATVKGSELLISLCGKYKIKKLIYMSSIGNYDISSLENNSIVKEETPLEKYIDLRGFYAKSKVLGEQIITSKFPFAAPTIVLRAGLVYAPNTKGSSLIGCGFIRKNILVNPGFRDKKIPFIHINDLYEAVKLALHSGIKNEIYNVVSEEQPKAKDIINLFNKYSPSKIKPFYIPKIFFIFNRLFDRFLPKQTRLGRYNYLLCRLQKNVYYSSEKIKKELNWSAKISFEETVKEMINFHYGQVKIGIVGCGFAFKTLHLPVILGNRQIKVKVLHDKDEQLAIDAKNRFFNDAKVYKNIDDFRLNKPDLDFIVILTPPTAHFSVAKYLIENNYNLLIEKPLCLKLNETLELKKLSNENGVKICVMNNYRFRKNVLTMRTNIKSEAPKIPDSIFVKFWSGPIIESAGGWRENFKEVLLYEMAYHFIDIALEFAGDVVKTEYLKIQRTEKNVITDVDAVFNAEKTKIYLDLKLKPPYTQTYIEARFKDFAYVAQFFPEGFRKLSGLSNPITEIKYQIKTVIQYLIDKKIKKDKNFSHRHIYEGFIKALKNEHERIPVIIEDIIPAMDLIEKISKN